MNHRESGEQAAVIQWSEYQSIPTFHLKLRRFLFSIPNGTHLAGDSKSRARQMAVLKKEGLTPGASDLLLAWPNQGYAGLFLEMKKRREDFRSESAARRAVSEPQVDFLDHMTFAGYAVAVCYGANEAIAAIMHYMGLNGGEEWPLPEALTNVSTRSERKDWGATRSVN